jgi:tripartite ATP-independent transporter DctP family solute receptor
MKRLPIALTVSALAATATSARAEDAQYTMKIATVAPDNTPWSELLKMYKANVEKESGGKIKVKVYLGGTLGDENESVLECKRGQIQAVGVSTGALASEIPDLNVVEIPFLFHDADEADYVIDGVLGTALDPIFKDYGFVLGFWSENGFRQFGLKDGFVKSPADLKGKKMRSQETSVHLDMWKAFGASPKAIPTTEVLTALQNGTVDGFDQALLYAIAASWYTSVKYFTISNHIYQPAVIAFNKDWFDGLPSDLQKVVVDEGRKIQAKGRKAIRKMNPKLIDALKDNGVKVYELTASERAAFEKAAEPVRANFRKTAGKRAAGLLDSVEAALKKRRGK